jgi:hypothetical protein
LYNIKNVNYFPVKISPKEHSTPPTPTVNMTSQQSICPIIYLPPSFGLNRDERTAYCSIKLFEKWRELDELIKRKEEEKKLGIPPRGIIVATDYTPTPPKPAKRLATPKPKSAKTKVSTKAARK